MKNQEFKEYAQAEMTAAEGIDPRFLTNTPEEWYVNYGVRGYVRRDSELGKIIRETTEKNQQTVSTAVRHALFKRSQI